MIQKRLMIIGSGWEQFSLVKAAKSSGYYVLATDPSPGPKSEAFGIADRVETLDPRDLKRATRLARDSNVDGVVADQCDYSQYAAVFVRQSLGLGGANFDAAQFTTNKRLMRERCRLGDVLQPEFFSCVTLSEATQAIGSLGLPVVVKPIDNRGSFGVQILFDENELGNAFFYAIQNSHSREVLIEKYVDGIHVTVDGCMDKNGKHHNLAVATKKVVPGSTPIIMEVYYPASLPTDILSDVKETNNRVISALGITEGLTHSEYIVDSRGACLFIETANRGGGVLTSSKIVPLISGVDVTRLLISNALDEAYDVRPRESNTHVILSFLNYPSGRVLSIEGFMEAMSLDGVIEARLNIKPGDVIFQPKSGAGRHGFFIIQGTSEAQVRLRSQQFRDTVTVNHY